MMDLSVAARRFDQLLVNQLYSSSAHHEWSKWTQLYDFLFKNELSSLPNRQNLPVVTVKPTPSSSSSTTVKRCLPQEFEHPTAVGEAENSADRPHKVCKGDDWLGRPVLGHRKPVKCRSSIRLDNKRASFLGLRPNCGITHPLRRDLVARLAEARVTRRYEFYDRKDRQFVAMLYAAARMTTTSHQSTPQNSEEDVEMTDAYPTQPSQQPVLNKIILQRNSTSVAMDVDKPSQQSQQAGGSPPNTQSFGQNVGVNQIQSACQPQQPTPNQSGLQIPGFGSSFGQPQGNGGFQVTGSFRTSKTPGTFNTPPSAPTSNSSPASHGQHVRPSATSSQPPQSTGQPQGPGTFQFTDSFQTSKPPGTFSSESSTSPSSSSPTSNGQPAYPSNTSSRSSQLNESKWASSGDFTAPQGSGPSSLPQPIGSLTSLSRLSSSTAGPAGQVPGQFQPSAQPSVAPPSSIPPPLPTLSPSSVPLLPPPIVPPILVPQPPLQASSNSQESTIPANGQQPIVDSSASTQQSPNQPTQASTSSSENMTQEAEQATTAVAAFNQFVLLPDMFKPTEFGTSAKSSAPQKHKSKTVTKQPTAPAPEHVAGLDLSLSEREQKKMAQVLNDVAKDPFGIGDVFSFPLSLASPCPDDFFSFRQVPKAKVIAFRNALKLAGQATIKASPLVIARQTAEDYAKRPALFINGTPQDRTVEGWQDEVETLTNTRQKEGAIVGFQYCIMAIKPQYAKKGYFSEVLVRRFFNIARESTTPPVVIEDTPNDPGLLDFLNDPQIPTIVEPAGSEV